MSEQIVIEHCSPTLAGIKTGNMFTVSIDKETDIVREIRELNKVLKKKGLRVIPLRKSASHVLIYVYRPARLKKDLSDPCAAGILKRKGYDCSKAECAIAQLIRHLKNDEVFPHEIGLFLGYPPTDVESFMNDSRSGVKCSGCWKAYSNAEEAKKTFMRYKKCTEVYRRQNKNGRSLEQLTVSCDRSLKQNVG